MSHPETAPKNTLSVISSAMKLILQPEPGRKICNPPADIKVSDYGAANDTATVWVTNMTETPLSCQGVSHEAGSVIVNGVPQAIAEGVVAMYQSHGLDKAIDVLVLLGYTDQYTTKRQFIRDNLSPAGKMVDEFTGVVKRDARDVKVVWRESDGNYYVLNNQKPHLIVPDILVRDYRLTDGSQIDLDMVPENS